MSSSKSFKVNFCDFKMGFNNDHGRYLRKGEIENETEITHVDFYLYGYYNSIL